MSKFDRAKNFRLPVIKTPEDVAALSHLNDEEKAMAVGNLGKVPPSDGWWMLGNDPELQAYWAMMERESTALLYPDTQMYAFGPMNLLTLAVAKRTRSDYQYGALASFTANQLSFSDLPADAIQKLPFLGDPDASVWSDEESFTVKFAIACIDLQMTDELFAKAVATWGEKKTLRHISWVSFVFQWAIMIEALGMKYVHSAMELKGVPLPLLQHIAEVFKTIRPEFQKIWESIPVMEKP